MPGVGTELARLASWFAGKEKCESCQRKAAALDKNGPDWAEENLDTVVRWLQQGAEKHFLMTLIPTAITKEAAQVMVRLAIKRTKEKISNSE